MSYYSYGYVTLASCLKKQINGCPNEVYVTFATQSSTLYITRLYTESVGWTSNRQGPRSRMQFLTFQPSNSTADIVKPADLTVYVGLAEHTLTLSAPLD